MFAGESSGMSFENFKNEMDAGLRPDGDVTQGTQFTMQEVVKLNDEAAQAKNFSEPEIITPEPTDPDYKSIKAIISGLVDEFIIHGNKNHVIPSALKRTLEQYNITNETHPHIMREVRIKLKEGAGAYFDLLRSFLLKNIAHEDSNSGNLAIGQVQDIIGWLTFLKANSVDVTDIANDTIAAIRKGQEKGLPNLGAEISDLGQLARR